MKTISLLSPANLDAAFALEQRCHTFPWSRQTFESNQGERYFNLGLFLDAQLIGFAITQVVLDEATLFNLAIDPDVRRQGHAQALLAYLEEALIARHVMTLWLEVRASNEGALALYRKYGFNEVTVRRNYYPAPGGREDAVIMALPLG